MTTSAQRRSKGLAKVKRESEKCKMESGKGNINGTVKSLPNRDEFSRP